MLYVIEERAAGRPGLVTDVGVRLPAPLTASGLAMLAALGRRAGSRAVLLARRLRAASRRRAGVAGGAAPRAAQRCAPPASPRRTGSVTPGFASVAVAVLDHAGHPAASVALTFPAAEVDADGRAVLAGRVARAAAQVAQRIRGRPLG